MGIFRSVALGLVSACSGVSTIRNAVVEVQTAVVESVERTRTRWNAVTRLRKPRRESFDEAVQRLKLTGEAVAALRSEFATKTANWFVLAAIALAFLLFTPASRNPVSHFLLSSGVLFLTASKVLIWHFRFCQTRDRALFDFKPWLERDPWVRTGVIGVVLLVCLYSLAYGGLALAADSFSFSQFTPPASDSSIGFLREVFGPIIDTLRSGADVKTASGKSPLGTMMGPYNSAVLFIGMVLVAFTSIKGTIASAQDGQVLGHQMAAVSHFLPLRASIGTVCLFPVASGYSLIQVGVLWLAIQSVGMADTVLDAGLDYVAETNMITAPNLPDSRPLAANILRFEVCMAGMNKQFEGANRPEKIVEKEVPQTITNAGELWTTNGAVDNSIPVVGIINSAKQAAKSTYEVVDFQWAATNGSYVNPVVCGSLKWEESSESWEGNGNLKISKQAIMNAHAQAVRTMIVDLRPFAEAIVAGQKPAPGALEQAAANYEATLVQAARSSVFQTSDVTREDFLKHVKDGGWIYLPAYYNQFIQINDVIQSALNTLPTSSAIDIEDKDAVESLQTYKDALVTAEEYIKHREPAPVSAYSQQASEDVKIPRSWEDAKRLLSRPAIAATHKFTQQLAGSNLSHVGQIKAVGDNIIDTAWVLGGSAATAAGFASAGLAKLSVGMAFDFGAAIAAISGILSMIVMALLAFGVWAAYYIPMIPFINGVTAVIKWLVLVFESILAAPIFAIAHVHPDGDDAIGKAGPGYMLILGNLLYPTLTVFGFFGSIWLAQPVTGFVNNAYMTAVIGAEHNSLSGLTAFVAYVGIYILIMTGVIHGVFTLPSWLPTNVLRYIGGAVSAHGIADNEGHEAAGGFRGGLAMVQSKIERGLERGQRGHAVSPSPTGEASEGGGGPSKAQENAIHFHE